MRLEVIDNHRSRFAPVPLGWHQRKMRFAVARYQTNKNEDDNPTVLSLTKSGLKVKTDLSFGKSTESYVGHQVVEVGQCVFTPRDFDATPILCGIADTKGCISNLYIVFDVSSQIDSRFLEYYFWGLKYGFQFFEKLSFGMRYSFNRTQFENIPLLHPDLEIQKKITDFLDSETARIDQLIEKKQRLIVLTRERSLSAIERAVTADAKFSKLGHHIKILPGFAFASEKFSSNDEDIRLLRGANVTPGKIRWDDVVYWPKDAVGGLDRFLLKDGDIVMGMDRPWISGGIRVAEISEIDIPALLLQRVCKITPLRTLSKEFLKLVLSSKKFLGYFEPELTGVSVPHISGDQIAGFRFSYMPLHHQEERAKVCAKILASNDEIIQRTNQSIARLQELRSSLITAAVTGQIDVMTWSRKGPTDARLDAIEAELGQGVSELKEARA